MNEQRSVIQEMRLAIRTVQKRGSVIDMQVVDQKMKFHLRYPIGRTSC